jgi:Ca2+-binding EF-hand superfamily protein
MRTEENFFTTCISEILGLEKDLEILKVNLSRRDDFNLIDAFAMLDDHCHSSITVTELRDKLNAMGLFLAEGDLRLLFVRFVRDGERMTYSQFSDAMIPSD